MPASSRRPKKPMNASSSRPPLPISIRCGCARSCARWTAPASCRSSCSPTRARTTASSAAWNSASTTILIRPIDQQELTARLRTQVRRKRYNDHLRASVTQTIEMAVTDGLTGLHNRRYLDSHLQTLFDRAVARRRPLSLMITDLDRFKEVNDTYGHDVRRRRPARVRQAPAQECPRHRPCLPVRRRGIRRRHARYRGRDCRAGRRTRARRDRRHALRRQRQDHRRDGQRRRLVAEAWTGLPSPI